MLLNPHYGADPVLVLEGDPTAILAPTVRQRRRLAATVAGFTEAEWSHPSRCDGWSSRDVIVHLDGTNFFWTQSIAAGLRGDPTRYLATFDPVASPATVRRGVAGAVVVGRARPLRRVDQHARRTPRVARARRLDAARRGPTGTRRHQCGRPSRPVGLVGARARRPAPARWPNRSSRPTR